MLDLFTKEENAESSEELGRALVQLIEDTLDLRQWNFKQSYLDFSKIIGQKFSSIHR